MNFQDQVLNATYRPGLGHSTAIIGQNCQFWTLIRNTISQPPHADKWHLGPFTTPCKHDKECWAIRYVTLLFSRLIFTHFPWYHSSVFCLLAKIMMESFFRRNSSEHRLTWHAWSLHKNYIDINISPQKLHRHYNIYSMYIILLNTTTND